eukprot:g3082.t1
MLQKSQRAAQLRAEREARLSASQGDQTAAHTLPVESALFGAGVFERRRSVTLAKIGGAEDDGSACDMYGSTRVGHNIRVQIQNSRARRISGLADEMGADPHSPLAVYFGGDPDAEAKALLELEKMMGERASREVLLKAAKRAPLAPERPVVDMLSSSSLQVSWRKHAKESALIHSWQLQIREDNPDAMQMRAWFEVSGLSAKEAYECGVEAARMSEGTAEESKREGGGGGGERKGENRLKLDSQEVSPWVVIPNALLDGQDRSIELSRLPPASNFFEFRVRAQSPAGGWGPFSQTSGWVCTPQPELTRPSPPTLAESTDSTIALRWEYPSSGEVSVTSFELYGRRSADAPWKRLCSGSMMSHVVGRRGNLLAPGTSYSFFLRAHGLDGKSLDSQTVCYMTESLSGTGNDDDGAGIVDTDNSKSSGRGGVLPLGWATATDAEGREYFYHESGVTQWTLPERYRLPAKDVPFERKRFEFLLYCWGHTTGTRDPYDIEVDRGNLLFDSVSRLSRASPEDLRKRLRVTFAGEAGIDSGGLAKDWYVEIVKEVLNSEICMFRRHETGVYDIDPRSNINGDISNREYFTFVGKVLAKAVFERQICSAHLTRATLKQIVCEDVTLEDMRDVDPAYYCGLRWMLENDIDGVIYETFTVAIEEFGSIQEVELVQGGSTIEVTNENKHEYISEVVKFRLCTSVKKQMQALCDGFYSLIPKRAAACLRPDELRLLFNGTHEIDVKDLKSKTRYTGGLHENSLVVLLFWQLMSKLSVLDRAKIIRFATGSPGIPLDGLEPDFTMTAATSEGATDGAALPVAHTCFNQLVLPSYQKLETLREKMFYAIPIARSRLYSSLRMAWDREAEKDIREFLPVKTPAFQEKQRGSIRLGFKSRKTERYTFKYPAANTLRRVRHHHAVQHQALMDGLPVPRPLACETRPRTAGLSHARTAPELKLVVERYRVVAEKAEQMKEVQRMRAIGFSNLKLDERDRLTPMEVRLPEATKWFKGQRVECNFKGMGRWYPGTIARIHHNFPSVHPTFDVRYEWGQKYELQVPENRLRWCPTRRPRWRVGQIVVVNYQGSGRWYTAVVAKVNDDGSRSADIRYDGKMWPIYEAGVPTHCMKAVEWFIGQAVLANFKGRGRWYPAHVESIENRTEAPGDAASLSVSYDKLGLRGDVKRIERGVPQECLRPLLKEMGPTADRSLPILIGDNWSTMLPPLGPHVEIQKHTNHAWFWGSTAHSQLTKTKAKAKGAIVKKVAAPNPKPNSGKVQPECTDRFGRNIAPAFASSESELESSSGGSGNSGSAARYNEDGHRIVKKARPKLFSEMMKNADEETSSKKKKKQCRKKQQQKTKRNMDKQEAILAISRPSSLPYKRAGAGLEQVTVAMPAKYASRAGFTVRKHALHIDGTDYRTRPGEARVFATMLPGGTMALREELQRLTSGNSNVHLTTAEERINMRPIISNTASLNSDDTMSRVNISGETDLPFHRLSPAATRTLYNRAQRGDLAHVRDALQINPEAVHHVMEATGRNLLHAAAKGCHVELIEYLLFLGADATLKDHFGRLPVDYAYEGHDSASGQQQSWEAIGALSTLTFLEAAKHGVLERVHYLLTKRGVDVNAANPYGMTALHFAAINASVPLVEMLTEHGASWKSVNNVGQTPYDIATESPSAKALHAARKLGLARIQDASAHPMHLQVPSLSLVEDQITPPLAQRYGKSIRKRTKKHNMAEAERWNAPMSRKHTGPVPPVDAVEAFSEWIKEHAPHVDKGRQQNQNPR